MLIFNSSTNSRSETTTAIKRLYNAHDHKLRFPAFEKAQFMTALGITFEIHEVAAQRFA